VHGACRRGNPHIPLPKAGLTYEDAAVDDAEDLIESSHRAWGAFITGDPEPALALFSRRDDVTIGNPFGPYARGWADASATIARAATLYRDGEVESYERVATYASGELVVILEVERYRARIDGGDEVQPFSLRVSTVVRLEEDGWRIASRHADPITAPRSPGSLFEGAAHT